MKLSNYKRADLITAIEQRSPNAPGNQAVCSWCRRRCNRVILQLRGQWFLHCLHCHRKSNAADLTFHGKRKPQPFDSQAFERMLQANKKAS